MFKTIEEVKNYIKDQEIEFIDFRLIDIFGGLRHLCIPACRFNEKTLTEGIGFDGSNYGYAGVENSDMVFIPDLSSAWIDPFVERKTLSMFADVKVIGAEENHDYDHYPRNVIKAALKSLKDNDIADEMLIAPEYEFTVLDEASWDLSPQHMSYSIKSSETASDLGNGNIIAKGQGYHCSLPMDSTHDLRNDICTVMSDAGIDVKYHHHEVGESGQLEIEVELGEAAKLADQTILAKYIIRNTAQIHGLIATLMPKPVYGEAGNGMHIHMLLKKDGKNVFYDQKNYGKLSQTALYFIGGILSHVRSICAFTNPTTNSYKRLVPGFEAPVTIGYAMANRSAVVRIPAYVKSTDKIRFELRNPDATCNPYFAIAAIIMAGIDGIRNRIDPSGRNWGPFDFNLFDLSKEEKKKLEHLPASLDEALKALEDDHDYLTRDGVFPKELIDSWIEAISEEERLVNIMPTPAEFSRYFNR